MASATSSSSLRLPDAAPLCSISSHEQVSWAKANQIAFDNYVNSLPYDENAVAKNPLYKTEICKYASYCKHSIDCNFAKDIAEQWLYAMRYCEKTSRVFRDRICLHKTYVLCKTNSGMTCFAAHRGELVPGKDRQLYICP